eukprot:3736742-Rhodomonas_salina.1
MSGPMYTPDAFCSRKNASPMSVPDIAELRSGMRAYSLALFSSLLLRAAHPRSAPGIALRKTAA